MKIVSSFLESVAGIERYPVLSFLIFFIFFLAVTWYVVTLDKKYIREVSEYPISEDDEVLPDNPGVKSHNQG
jgi:cytochrome c oxidase cbb3-type subunit IV